MRFMSLVLCTLLQVIPLDAAATDYMTLQEFADLCGNGRDTSRECVLYVQGMIDGVMERTSQEAWKCKCEPSPSEEKLRDELRGTSSGDSWFIVQHPFETFGACISPEERGVVLDASTIAKKLLARYEEAKRDVPEGNTLGLNPASKLLVWVLADQARESCARRSD